MSELQKTIQLARPYIGDLTKVSNKILGEVRGISDKNVRWVGLRSVRAVVLSPGEVGGLVEKHDIELTNGLVEELTGYLEDHLPDSVDETLTVPTFPIKVHEVLTKPNQRLITIAGQNPVIHEERRVARLLTEEFFGVDGNDNNWPEWDYMAEIPIVRTVGVSAAQKVSEYLLRKSSLLPQTTKLGPVDCVELNRERRVGPALINKF